VAGVVVTGNASLTVQATFPAFRAQSLVSAYTKDSIQHLRLALFVVTDTTEAPALQSDGVTPITADLVKPTGSSTAFLDVPVTFSKLKPNTTYRVKAFAYKAAGTDALDLISTLDANSYATITLGAETTPTLAEQLKVTLISQNVSMGLLGGNMALDTGTKSGDLPQKQQAIVYNSEKNEYLQVYAVSKTGYNGQTADICARRMDADGLPIGDEITIVSEGTTEEHPDVTYNPQSNEYFVVWTDNRSNRHIYGQRLTDTGSKVGAAIKVSASVQNAQELDARVTYNATDNQYMVVWVNPAYAVGQSMNVVAQRLDANGGLVGAMMNIATNTYNDRAPVVAWSPAQNQYLIAWADEGASPSTISAVRINGADGTQAGGPITVSTGDQFKYSLEVVYNATADEFFLVWMDNRSVNSGLYGQRLKASDGTLLGTTAAANFPIALSVSSAPKVAFNPSVGSDGEYLVTWDQYGTQKGQRILAGTLALSGASFTIDSSTMSKLETAVAYNSTTQDYIVTWPAVPYSQDFYPRYNLYAARVGPSFTPGTPTKFGTSQLPATQNAPDVAFNSANSSYLMVWQDHRANDEGQIYGRRLNASGMPDGAAFVINNEAGYKQAPRVIYNPTTDSFVVFWNDQRNTGGGRGVYAQQMNADLTFNGTPVNVLVTDNPPADYRFAHSPASGEYLMVWSHHAPSGNGDVYAQRLSATGTIAAIGTPRNVTAEPNTQSAPSIAYNAQADEFLVTWSDGRLAGAGSCPPCLPSSTDIFAQRIKAGGTPLASSVVNTLIANDAAPLSNPSVAYNSQANEYVVSFEQFNLSTFKTDLYAQRISANGAPAAGNIFAVSTAAENQVEGELVYNPQADEYLLTWQDKRLNNSYSTRIYGQRLNVNGTLIGTEFAIGDTVELNVNQTWHSLAYNSNSNEYFLTWADTRNGNQNSDIYGQRLDSFGTP
jgi:hypothetical protein